MKKLYRQSMLKFTTIISNHKKNVGLESTILLLTINNHVLVLLLSGHRTLVGSISIYL